MSAAAIAALLVRCGLVVLFLPFSAADKLFGFANARKQAEEMFPRPLATLAILVGIGIEIVCTSAVIAGVADRAAALVLAGYCVATALLFKRFWAPGDFWSAPGGKGRTLFWDFLKNCSLGAGFLLIVVGPNGSGLKPFLHAPFASSHPYASPSGDDHE